MKKILFIGLGSIGQRHLRNLKSLKKKFKYFAVRSKKTSPLLDKDNNAIANIFYSKENGVKEISLAKAKKIIFYIVFICNPSSMHLKYASFFLNSKTALFIEKPISHNFINIEKFKNTIVKKNIICAVGYQLRYEKILFKLKRIILSGKFGKIRNVKIRNRHYLPYHHKYEDYKRGYAAMKKLGGGVTLCFIHEIDYILFLFGSPNYLQCKLKNKSELKIDVEDYASINFYYSENYDFKINLILDFIKRKEERFCQINFESGRVLWDLKKNTLETVDKKHHKTLYSSSKNRDTLFKYQLKSFLNSIEKKSQPNSNFNNGIESLKLALLAKKSSKINKKINL